MDTLKRISSILYLLVILMSLVFAALYLFKSEFMPYHAKAVGMPWSEVPRKFQILILALMRVCGGGWLVTAVSMAFLLFIPFRHYKSWANWGILFIALSGAIPTLIATLFVKCNTRANPPWLAAIISILVLLIAFFLSKISRKDS